MKPNTTGLVAGGFAVFLLLVNLALLWDVAPLLLSGVRAEGVVVDMRESRKRLNRSPIVEFATATGEKVRITGHGFSSPPSADLGEKVSVAYDPARPGAGMLLLWGEHAHRIFFAAVGCVVWFAWTLLPAAQRRLWEFEPGTRSSLAGSGVPAVATILRVAPAKGVLVYRIETDAARPYTGPHAEKVRGFLKIEVTTTDWRPVEGQVLKKGDRFRAWLSPADPGRAYYVDFTEQLGREAFANKSGFD